LENIVFSEFVQNQIARREPCQVNITVEIWSVKSRSFYVLHQ